MRRIYRVGAQVLAATFPKCGIEMRNQMRRDASTLNLPIGKCELQPFLVITSLRSLGLVD